MRPGICYIVAGFIAATVSTATPAMDIVPWYTDMDSAFATAKKQNVPILIHFWTPDCVPCIRLEHHVFNRKSVSETLVDFFVPVKINAAQNPAIAAKYKVDRFPTDVIVGPNNEELHRMITPQNAQQYIAQLSAVAFRSGLVPKKSKEKVANDNHFAGFGYQPESNRFQSNPTNDSNSYGGPNQQIPNRQITENRQKETVNPFVSKQTPYDANAYNPRPEKQNDLVPQRNEFASEYQSDSYDQSNDFVPEKNESYQQAVSSSEYRSADSQSQRPSMRVPGPANQQQVNAMQRPVVNGPAVAAVTTQSNNENSAKIALDGYCPVSLIRSDTWKKGDPRWGVVHRGRIYLFVGQREKDEFFARPDEYSPVLSGIDPVALTDSGSVHEGKRAHGVVFRKRVYLFNNEENLKRFWKSPDAYSSSVMQAMNNGKMYR